jgi:hypothetical protein
VELVAERMNRDGALVPVADDTMLVEPTAFCRAG